MPRIASSPAVQPVPVGLPSTTKSLAEKKAAMAESLARTDMYVNSTWNTLEHASLSLYNAHVNTQAAMASLNNGSRVVTDYTNVVGSVKRAAIQRTVTSTVGNGWQLFRGKVTLAEAGGRVVGDVTASAATNAASAIATNVAVWGLSKAGVSSFPVMVGGMIAGWGASTLTNRVMQKTGATEFVINQTTQALQSLGSSNEN